MVPTSPCVPPPPLAKMEKVDAEGRQPSQIPCVREVLRIAHFGADIGLVNTGVIDIVGNLAERFNDLAPGQLLGIHGERFPKASGNPLNPANDFSAFYGFVPASRPQSCNDLQRALPMSVPKACG